MGIGPGRRRPDLAGDRIRNARARPRNTSVMDLMTDDKLMEAVLKFLATIRVGEVREGAPGRGSK